MPDITRFTNLPTSWVGTGTNHENEAFTATLRMESLVDGKAVKIDYVMPGREFGPKSTCMFNAQ